MIVLHYTAMDDAEAALGRLCDPGAEVSAHYLIARTGQVFRLVDEGMRAWHAGAGGWGGVTDVNSRSVGIELDNTGAQPFSEPLMAALEALLPGIMDRWGVAPARVIAHSDMAPERKSDPGRRFDWRRLARRGLSVWPEPDAAAGAADARRFHRAADGFGYPAAGLAPRLAAFRQRFRPAAAGPLAGADVAALEDLARRFPVDRAGTNA